MPFFKQKKVERRYEDGFLKLPCYQYRSVLGESVLVYWEKGKKKRNHNLAAFRNTCNITKNLNKIMKTVKLIINTN